MKYLTFLLILIVLGGCAILFDPWENLDYWFRHEEEFGDNGDEEEDVREVLSWMRCNITWEDDNIIYEESEYWDEPKELYDLRKGDCDGYSILAGCFIWVDCGIDEVYIISMARHNEITGRWSGHCILKVLVNGVYHYLEPQASGRQFDWIDYDPTEGWIIDAEYHIKKALWSAVNTHEEQPIWNAHYYNK